MLQYLRTLYAFPDILGSIPTTYTTAQNPLKLLLQEMQHSLQSTKGTTCIVQVQRHI